MRLFKKSLAMLLVVAMMMSLVSVSVFAATGEITLTIKPDKAYVGQGGKIVYSIYAKANGDSEVTAKGNSFNIYFDNTNVTAIVDASNGADYWYKDDENSPSFGVTEQTAENRFKVLCSYDGNVTAPVATEAAPDGLLVGKFEVTLAEDAATAALAYTVDAADQWLTMSNNIMIIDVVTTTAEVQKSFTVATVDALTDVNVGLGTTTPVLPATVTVKGENFATDDTETGTLSVGQWTSADYNKDVANKYTFTAPVVSNGILIVPDGKVAKVEVIVGKITVGSENYTKPENYSYKKSKTAATKAVTDILADLNGDANYNKVELSNEGSYKEEVSVTYTSDATTPLDLERVTAEAGNETNKVTVTGTVDATSATNYQGTTTFTIDVVVVPAEIENGGFTVSPVNSATVPSVTSVTFPKEASYNTSTVITAKVFAVAANAPTGEALDTVTYTLAADDITADANIVLENKLVFTKDMDGMGFATGDKFAVVVEVDGAAILVDGNPYLVSDVASKGGSSVGGTGFTKPGTTTTPDPVDPEDPEDPVDPEDPADPTDPEDPVDTPSGFTDVPEDHYAYAYIELLAELGVVGGKGGNTYDPEGALTRAELTKMVSELFGATATSTEVTFLDCADDAWYTPYVAAAVEAGFVTGYSAEAFGPEDPVTREQVCAIVGRALAVINGDADIDFTDAEAVSEYAKAYIAALAEMGLINGYEDGSFAPLANITRAEIATILGRAIQAGHIEIMTGPGPVVPEEEAPVDEEAPVEEAVEGEVVEEEATEEEVTAE